MTSSASLVLAPGKGAVPAVRDADLVKRVDDASGFMRDIVAKQCAREQEDRDRLAAMSDPKRRRVLTGRKFEETGGIQREDLSHIHSVLAVCALPYQRQDIKVRTWERKQGNMNLVVNAGSLSSPSGEWIDQPLPYGSRARLILLHTCTQAIRQKSATIEIEDSLSAFIRRMGFEVTGGKNGTLSYFKQQIHSLAACNMKIGLFDGKRSKTVNTQPFAAIDVWFPRDPSQPNLWSSTLTFSQDFYQTLTKHALPVNDNAVKAFANSARKLDIYWWLCGRTYGLEKPLAISWEALKEQFGYGYARDRRFRTDFAQEIGEIKEVFPRLPVKLTEDGFIASRDTWEVLAIPNLRK